MATATCLNTVRGSPVKYLFLASQFLYKRNLKSVFLSFCNRESNDIDNIWLTIQMHGWNPIPRVLKPLNLRHTITTYHHHLDVQPHTSREGHVQLPQMWQTSIPPARNSTVVLSPSWSYDCWCDGAQSLSLWGQWGLDKVMKVPQAHSLMSALIRINSKYIFFVFPSFYSKMSCEHATNWQLLTCQGKEQKNSICSSSTLTSAFSAYNIQKHIFFLWNHTPQSTVLLKQLEQAKEWPISDTKELPRWSHESLGAGMSVCTP